MSLGPGATPRIDRQRQNACTPGVAETNRMFKVLAWQHTIKAIKQKSPRSRGLPLLASQTVKSLKLVFVKLPFRHLPILISALFAPIQHSAHVMQEVFSKVPIVGAL